MAGGILKIPIFTGEDPENENPTRFLRQVEYSFAPISNQYTTGDLQIDVARVLFLQSYASKTADKWVEEATDELMENWTAFKEAFVRRFSMKAKHNSLADAFG